MPEPTITDWAFWVGSTDDIRNVVLVVGGLWALRLATVRTMAARDQADVAGRREATEAFTRAIDQLGHESIEVRIGAIYALGHIAADSERHHWPIMETLAAYVRERSPRKYLTSDTQTIAMVFRDNLGRFPRPSPRHGVPWRAGLNLRGADLHSTNLSGAYLSEVNLSEAYLSRAKLFRADLSKADLSGADLSGADLSEADLSEAVLHGADLSEANLSGADLSGADLSGAKLHNTDLEGAILKGAILKDTILDKRSRDR